MVAKNACIINVDMFYDEHIIWEDVADDRYDCRVRYIGNRLGELIIEDLGNLIYKMPISLPFRIGYTPSKKDIGVWEDMILEVIDTMETKMYSKNSTETM